VARPTAATISASLTGSSTTAGAQRWSPVQLRHTDIADGFYTLGADMTTDTPDSGIAAVVRYLDDQGVRHEIIEHRTTHTAVAEARAAGVPPEDAAKTIALRDEQGYRLAVIPASARLDLGKVRALLGAGKALRLATEEEMASDFEDFEVGALPPFGPLLPAAEILDRRLLEHERILCSGGDHRHGVLVDPREIVRVADPRVADVCED
jgi:Ala-tRNA(Pro) deacylase